MGFFGCWWLWLEDRVDFVGGGNFGFLINMQLKRETGRGIQLFIETTLANWVEHHYKEKFGKISQICKN